MAINKIFTPKEVLVPLAIGIAIAVVLVIVTFLAYVSTRPPDIHIERTAEINAPRDVVFSLINDLHQWSSWSPFEKYDPNMKKTYEGPGAGPGASYAWSGNSKAGEGRMTIGSTSPPELVTMKLEFIKPFTATNDVQFKIVPSGQGSRVSWIMDGKSNFMMKLMSLFMNMDQMVGKDFEEGLANLNRVAQSASARV